MNDEKQAETWFDLKPNRDLLDFNFEGYKLSLDSLAQYKIEFKQKNFNSIDITPNQLSSHIANSASNKQGRPYLYQHIKLFNLYNHLIFNEYNTNAYDLYYFDSNWCLMKISINKSTDERKLVETNLKLVKPIEFYNDRVSLSMKFLSDKWAVVNDGCDSLYFCELDCNSNDTQSTMEMWKIQYKYSLANDNCEKSLIKDASCHDNKQINCILVNITERPDQKSVIKYETIINWLQFDFSSNSENPWSLGKLRKFNCSQTVPDYVCLSRSADKDGVVIAGSSSIKYMNGKDDDSQTETPDGLHVGPSLSEWSQSAQEIDAVIELNAKNIDKNELQVKLNSRSLEISYKNETLLDERFLNLTINNESTWTLDSANGKLGLHLQKSEVSNWNRLFQNSKLNGADRESDFEANIVDTQPLVETNGSTMNPIMLNLNQDLEECDGVLTNDVLDASSKHVECVKDAGESAMSPDDYYMLMCFDGQSDRFTYKSYINTNKFLFQLNKYSNQYYPGICLRYDVDGILWRPDPDVTDDNHLFEHDYTFLAFGYVHASKQNAKYTLAPFDCSYACICDTNKHVYIYKQKSEKVETVLRNRKSGSLITHVSKQYVVSLDTDMEIMGAYCSNELTVLLLENSVYFIRVNS